MITKFPKMNKVEVVRSDISGKFFPVEECEIVVVKIVKAKNEDMNGFSMFKQEIVKTVEEKPLVIMQNVKDENPLLDPASPEYKKLIHKKNSAIPLAMRDLFKKPAGLDL